MMRVLSAAVIALLTFAPVGAQASSGPLITDGRSVASPAPLIVVLHGFTATGPAMQRKTRFDALVQEHGFVVAYPSGPARRWDDRSAGSQDVQTLTALITALIADGRADPAQIYLAGHSNGGGMAMRMACARPDLIRAIAVVAMNAPLKPHCTDARPMPALFIHGTDDPIVPPAGLPDRRSHGGLLSSARTLKDWAMRNRCAAPAPAQVFNQTGGDTTARYVRYQRCAAPLLHITLTGHGHEWPGAGPRARWIQGPASRELDAAEAIWAFFSRL